MGYSLEDLPNLPPEEFVKASRELIEQEILKAPKDKQKMLWALQEKVFWGRAMSGSPITAIGYIFGEISKLSLKQSEEAAKLQTIINECKGE